MQWNTNLATLHTPARSKMIATIERWNWRREWKLWAIYKKWPPFIHFYCISNIETLTMLNWCFVCKAIAMMAYEELFHLPEMGTFWYFHTINCDIAKWKKNFYFTIVSTRQCIELYWAPETPPFVYSIRIDDEDEMEELLSISFHWVIKFNC